MTGRILLTALAAAIAMFVWSSLAHTVLHIGDIGVKTMAEGEPAAIDALRTATGDKSGLYVAPAAAMTGQAPADAPSVFLVYHSPSVYVMSPMQLIGEFVLELIQAIVLVFILAQMMNQSMGSRIGWAVAAGVMVGIATNGSYHLWYGFPPDYTFAMIGIQVVGYLLIGIVAGLLLPWAKHA